MKKFILATLALVILLGSSFAVSASQAAASVVDEVENARDTAKFTVQNHILEFKDVASTHWAYSAIHAAVRNGYFKGYTDGTFKPSSPVTKAEMATILGRLDGQPIVSAATSSVFSDVPAWALESVTAAIQKGFIDPSKYNGKLNSNTPLTRGELATWLAKGLGAINPDYKTAISDVTNTVIPAKEYFLNQIPDNQKNYIAVMMGTRLMSVASDKTFGFDRTTTRAEVATLLARYINVSKKQPDDFLGLRELRAVGLTGSNIKIIAPFYTIGSVNGSNTLTITDDFSKIRNKELKTVTNYADVKLNNLIIVNPNVKGQNRSIYYPVFLDEGSETTNDNGAYFAFSEYSMKIKTKTMTVLQAGSLITSPTINPSRGIDSKACIDYSVPEKHDTTDFGLFTTREPHYWGLGLLHTKHELTRYLSLTTKDNINYYIFYGK